MNDFKARDKQIESGKISNALQCLSDDANGGVQPTSDEVTIKRKYCTVTNLLQEKQPCSQKADLKYVVYDLKNRDFSFHPSNF